MRKWSACERRWMLCNMASGLRFESLADMPEGMRKLAAEKMVAGRRSGTDTATEGTARIPHPPLRGTLSPGEGKGPAAQGEVKGNKYRNVEAEVGGIRFQSRKEARRYEYLCRAVQLGVIEDLRLQVHFTLQEAYTTPTGERIRAIRYVADFTYRVKSAGYDHAMQLGLADIEYWRSLYPGALVIEDTKSRGTRTKEYQIKRKLMADKGYEIREV